MINTRFRHANQGDYTVWGKLTSDDQTGEITWICREYWTDRTGYFTTSEINEDLAWMSRQGITL